MPRATHRPYFVNWKDYGSDSGFPGFPDHQILAEGDSWFTVSGIPAYNLLFELRFHHRTCIVNCGFPGDTIKHMSQISKNRYLWEALSRWGGVRWNLILLSGGGNDLIDNADDIIFDKGHPKRKKIKNPADYCDQDKLKRLIEDLQEGYRKIAAIRDAPDSPNRGVPILTHTYDYATPRNSPARFGIGRLGPWLYRALTNSHVPEKDWTEVANYLIKKLADGILALGKGRNKIENFYVVNTLGLLEPAEPENTGPSTDWQNEIHPNGNGYAKLAAKVGRKLRKLIE